MGASYQETLWIDDIMVPLTVMAMENEDESLGGEGSPGEFSETSRSPAMVTETEQVMLLFIALFSTD